MRRQHCFLLSFVALLSVGISSSAFAGFQWVAPPKPVVENATDEFVPAPSELTAMPMQDVGSELLPEPMDGQAVPMPIAMQSAPASDQMSAMMDVMPPAPTMEQKSPYAVIAGFGRDIPMVMALGQIVPPEYSYSFGTGVNQGIKITWNGGKPWDAVLANALMPAGYEAVIRNRHIAIQKSSGNLSAPPMMSASAPEAAAQPMQLSDAPAPEFVSPQAGTEGAMFVAPHAVPPTMPMPQDVAATGDVSDFWHADQGESLRTVVDTWSKDQNIQVIWQAEGDYVLPKTIHSDGTYQEALAAALESFNNTLPRPVGELHVGQDGAPPTLVVTTYSN
jgi:hypothetical protein